MQDPTGRIGRGFFDEIEAKIAKWQVQSHTNFACLFVVVVVVIILIVVVNIVRNRRLVRKSKHWLLQTLRKRYNIIANIKATHQHNNISKIRIVVPANVCDVSKRAWPSVKCENKYECCCCCCCY
jgi:ABC-type uncharacterized transport system fused permease/ATPase subunit